MIHDNKKSYNNRPLNQKTKTTIGDLIANKIRFNPTITKALNAANADPIPNLEEVDKILKNFYQKHTKLNKEVDAYAATTLLLKNKKLPISNKEYGKIFGEDENKLAKRCKKIQKHGNQDYELGPIPLKHWTMRRRNELLPQKIPGKIAQKILENTENVKEKNKLQGHTNRVISAAIIYKTVKNRDDKFFVKQKEIEEKTGVSENSIRKIYKKI